VPGWPGEAIFPPQPQIAQTRAVFEHRQAHGGSVREVVLPGVGHGPLIERAEQVATALVEHTLKS
jgi:pimeloyl-ACP methyl ester carboxylesterase